MAGEVKGRTEETEICTRVKVTGSKNVQRSKDDEGERESGFEDVEESLIIIKE